jgi:hypothetical protein
MKIHLLSLLATSFLMLQSCGGSSNENQAEQDDAFISVETEDESGKTNVTIDSDNLGDALNKAMEDATDGKAKAKEVVDYQELQDLMPSSIIGMERTAMSGQKSGAMGQNLSTAEAAYENGDKSLKISAIDAGGSSFALAGLAMWADTEVSREDANGYERTTKIDGYKAFEQYNNRDQTGQVNVLVEDRFIINVEGNNISGEELRRAMDQLNLKKLARMN